jgi:hypothetical protein
MIQFQAARRASVDFFTPTWVVTAKAIRQATDAVVAAYKASLFGDHCVLDLCGGIGGDAVALARRGVVATVDCDPQATAMAAVNLQLDRRVCRSAAASAEGTPTNHANAIAICADVTRYPIPEGVAVHIDPDRRPDQRRTIRPSSYLPSLSFVQHVLTSRVAGVVKLAPAAALEEESGGLELSRRHHRQWISLDSRVREQALLCGGAIAAAGVTAGGRSAVRLMRDGTQQRFVVDAPTNARLDELDALVDRMDVPAELIFDFDPAVRGGGLSAALALSRGLAALGEPAGFFTGSALPEDRSMMQCFATLWSGPADRKQIKRELRQHKLSLQSVKVRGTGHDPADLQRALRPDKVKPAQNSAGGPGELQGAEPVTLLIGRHHRGVYAVLGRKVPQ